MHKRLEDYITETQSTKTEVILTALAQYFGATEKISLSQRVAALEAQIAELKHLVKSNTSAI